MDGNIKQQGALVGAVSTQAAMAVAAVRVRGALEATAQYLAGKIARAAPVGATSNLRGSIIGEPVRTVGDQMFSSVSSNVEYATVVEQGGRPHMPPIGPLINWVQRKLGANETDAVHIAWAIAKSIEKRGTSARGTRQGPSGGHGYWMFEDTLVREEANVNRLFLAPLGLELVRSIG